MNILIKKAIFIFVPKSRLHNLIIAIFTATIATMISFLVTHNWGPLMWAFILCFIYYLATRANAVNFLNRLDKNEREKRSSFKLIKIMVKRMDFGWAPILGIFVIILLVLSSWTSVSLIESIPIPLGILVGYIMGILNVYAELIKDALA